MFQGPHVRAFFSPHIDAGSEPLPYIPRFSRNSWQPEATHLDRFFDRFVPVQYAEGFAWRSRCIGGDEVKRTTPFEEQSEQVQQIIANNAEVLLHLYTNTAPASLDRMREAGAELVKQGFVSSDAEYGFDLVDLRIEMASRHHATWRVQFLKDVAAGLRSDPEHRGALENIEDLPLIEQQILKVQTWGNWRILALMSDDDYQIVRDAAVAVSSNK